MRRRLALACASVLLALLCGELGFQLLYRVRAGQWLAPPPAFTVPFVVPVADDREYTLRPGFRDDTTTLDPLGFRIGAGGPVPPGPAVVVVGDSVPFGAGVRDGETYPALMDRQLSKDGIRVLNGGVPSYTIRQSIRRLQLEVLPRWRPRVVLLQAANEVSLFAALREAWTPESTWASQKFSLRSGLGLHTRLATLHYVQQARTALRSRLAGPDGMAAQRRRLTLSLAAEVRALRADPRLAGVPIVLLPVDPFYFQGDLARSAALPAWSGFSRITNAWADLVKDVNAALAGAADPERGLHWFDTRALLDRTGRQGMYVDWIHLSPRGADVVATALVELVRAQGWLRANP